MYCVLFFLPVVSGEERSVVQGRVHVLVYIFCVVFPSSCQWGGEECGVDNMTLEFTDHGVCYTFNYDTLHNIDQTGELATAYTTCSDSPSC